MTHECINVPYANMLPEFFFFFCQKSTFYFSGNLGALPKRLRKVSRKQVFGTKKKQGLSQNRFTSQYYLREKNKD